MLDRDTILGVDVVSVKVTRSGTLDSIRKRVGVEPRKTMKVGVLDRDVAEYATYVEYGWTQRVTGKQARFFRGIGVSRPPGAGGTLVMQPRPFMRGTVSAKQKEWLGLLGRIYANTKDTSRALALVGEQAVQDIQETIREGGTEGKKFDKRKPLTMEMLKIDSKGKKGSKLTSSVSNSNTDKPLMRTGLLLKSIAFQIEK